MLGQFGNNWIQKIPRTAKLDEAAVLGIFLIQLLPNWTACSPITYTKCHMTSVISYHVYKHGHHSIHIMI